MSKSISEKAKHYQVISFDIFDTLIKRNVGNPKDIFNIVENKYNKQHLKKIENYLQKRVEAEKEARALLGEAEEVSLNGIYDCLKVDDDIKLELKKMEIETELEYCEPNSWMVEEYQKCLDYNENVVLTSDMYLPQNVLEDMLNKCGITGYKKLYLSSEIGLKKSTGSLYEYVLRDMNISKKQIIHIGDGGVTDYLIPLKKGISALHIDRVKVNTAFLTKDQLMSENSEVFWFINNNLPKYKNKHEAFLWGYEAFGPLLLLFSEWVHEQKKEKNIDTLYFLARDMYVIYKVYKEIYPEDNIKYLEVSRKSLREEYIRKKDNFFSILDTLSRKKYKLEDLINSILIGEEDLEALKYQLKNYLEVGVENIIQSEAERCVINDMIMPYIRDTENYVQEYLKNEGLCDDKVFALVDIGWHGTIQNMLQTIIGHECVGLYFGNTRRENFPKMNMAGMWFDNENERETLQYISVVGILEVMLFPQRGTTLGYRKESKGISPYYANCEMCDYTFVNNYQEGAIQFVSDFLNSGIEDYKKSRLLLPFENMAYRPSVYQAKKMSRLMMEDGKTYPLAVKHKRTSYIINPKQLLKDYSLSKWKEGFIKYIIPWYSRPDKIDSWIKSRHKL